MVTDDIIRQQFVQDTLKEGIDQIYDVQEQVVQTEHLIDTGRLQIVLSAHAMDFESSEGRERVFVRLLPYLRFLDIQYRRRNDRISKKRRSRLALYNRVVWGVLYHETFPKIQYGLTDEVRTRIRQELENAVNPK